MKYPKLRELKEAVKSLFSPAYTTKFPKEAFLAADTFRGKPEYCDDDCVGCGACAEVCPASAIQVMDDLKRRIRTLTLKLDTCLFCGNCQANCITQKGIELTTQYDTAVYDRNEAIVSIDKELLVCEYCECIIGAKDHLKFLSKKLGVLVYANPALMLTIQKELKLSGLVDVSKKHKSQQNYHKSQPQEQIMGRAAMFKILCPRCRRAVLLKDEWGK